jgi:hypothetical protein
MEDLTESLGGDLLVRIAPGLVRVRVGLDHEAIESKVQRLLRDVLDELPPSGDVTRIGDDRNIRMPTAELDGQFPHRRISEPGTRCNSEPAMDHAQGTHSSAIDPFERAGPQPEVRTRGILHEDGNRRATQRICDFLHRERIDGGRAPIHSRSMP